MCQYALYSHPCGHHNLLLIHECETRKQNIQLASQLDETLPCIPPTHAKITHHYINEGIPITSAALAAASNEEITSSHCHKAKCQTLWNFNTAITVAARLRMAILETNSTYNSLHSKWLAQHFAMQKFRILATPAYLAARPNLKRKLEGHKEWARGLVKVERRLQDAERGLYVGLGDLEALKREVVMSRAWRGVLKDVHHARLELGMLRWEVEGNECW